MEFMVLVAAACIVRMMLMVMRQEVELSISVQDEEVLFCQVSAGRVVRASERGWSASRVRRGRCEDGMCRR